MPPNRRLSWMGLKSWQAGHRTWRRDQRDKRVRPTLTLLEERTLLSTLNLTVTTLADDPVTPISGQITLRDAITQANADTTDSQEVISFAPGLQGTIDLTQALPDLANNITISGPGASNLTIQRDSGAVPFWVFTAESPYNGNNMTVTVSGMTITAGETTNHGGGILNDWYGVDNCTLTVNNCAFTDNLGGSGIINNGGTLTVNNSVFTDNSAQQGGGISNGGTLTVTDSTFTSNSATQGGAIYVVGSTATVSNSSFTSNSATEGGGIWNDASTMSVIDSAFDYNSASYAGGIYTEDSALTLTNCTISSNNGSDDGGGIYNDSNGGLPSYSIVTLTNCTVSDNKSQVGGGIDNDTQYYPALVVLNNTIVAGNSATAGSNDISSGSIGGVNGMQTSAYNLIGNGTGISNLAQLASSNLIGTTADPINPLLGPLQNNGGPTQTMALLPGSPAIDAGSNALAVDANDNPLTTDQRGVGFPRILGHSVDIGAYEFTPLSQTISFGAIAGQTYGTTITLSATATSGLPVSYTVIPGSAPANISGNVLTVTGVGLVDIEADEAGNATYAAATPVDESFTAAPALLTITANNASKVYGAAIPSLSASYRGFVNGDTVAILTDPVTMTTTATASSSVLPGGYQITPSGASDPNYNISYIDGTLTVTPAPLTVTATNESMVYGGTVPVLTYTYTGLVNNDTSATFTGSLVTTATSSSNVGDYPITQGTLAATGNYTIGTYNPDTLTVTPAPLTVTATNESMTYGGTVPTLTYTCTGLVNKNTSATFTGSLVTTATSSSDVGDYPITQRTLAATGNYTIDTFNPGTLTVNTATLTITANNASKVYGGAIPVTLGELQGVCQWGYRGDPDRSSDHDHNSNRIKQCAAWRLSESPPPGPVTPITTSATSTVLLR